MIPLVTVYIATHSIVISLVVDLKFSQHEVSYACKKHRTCFLLLICTTNPAFTVMLEALELSFGITREAKSMKKSTSILVLLVQADAETIS